MEKAKLIPLSPHPFEMKLEVRGGPTIIVSEEAYSDMQSLIAMVEEEVSWMGEVEKIDGMTFLIKKIFLVNQVVNPAHTTMNRKNLAQLMTDVIKKEGVQAANKIVFWGHSHVEMEVEPSFEDERQMELFSESRPEFFIRGIGNKLGKLRFSVFFYKMGMALHDVPWMVETKAAEVDAAKWKQEIKAKVKKERGWRNVVAYRTFGSTTIPVQPMEGDDVPDYPVMPAQSRALRMAAHIHGGF